MAGFWELPSPELLPEARMGGWIGEVRHTITHHHFRIAVHRARVPRNFTCRPDLQWFRPEEWGALPLSTSARKALRLRPSSAAL